MTVLSKTLLLYEYKYVVKYKGINLNKNIKKMGKMLDRNLFQNH